MIQKRVKVYLDVMMIGMDQVLYYYHLSHCDLVTPYGDIDRGKHWLR